MSLRRATGQAAFAGDLALPGMLHLALRRSPFAHARVLRADATAARTLPGVAAVLTSEDTPRLLDEIVRFAGDRVAVAAAEDPELARRAAERVDVDFEALPAVFDVDAARLDDAAVAARVKVVEGDVDGTLAAAELVVTGEWSLPFSPAVSLEPPLTLTWLDEDRRLVVRSSAESPFRVRGALADRLGIPAARIRVVRPLVAGGSLGRSRSRTCAPSSLCAPGGRHASRSAPTRPSRSPRADPPSACACGWRSPRGAWSRSTSRSSSTWARAGRALRRSCAPPGATLSASTASRRSASRP
jgi:CO/xanthine dehydrogenase Mo-binding subunit